jgi:shikimate O-hydroxycinnamoyltransferase
MIKFPNRLTFRSTTSTSTGAPTYFMPSYFPTEGMLFLVPSYFGDGSVDAFVPVFQHDLQAFKECCYSME